MISHEHKAIFIHVPRTGGTSIEQMLTGSDWWLQDKRTKHITASHAKVRYAEYWDAYYKFSFVRNPWDLTVSMWHTSHDKRINKRAGKTLAEYLKVMKAHRFEVEGMAAALYLDYPVDFIGRFENYQEDVDSLCSHLEVVGALPHLKKTKHQHYATYYNEETKTRVAEIFAADIERFGYTYGEAD